MLHHEDGPQNICHKQMMLHCQVTKNIPLDSNLHKPAYESRTNTPDGNCIIQNNFIFKCNHADIINWHKMDTAQKVDLSASDPTSSFVQMLKIELWGMNVNELSAVMVNFFFYVDHQ